MAVLDRSWYGRVLVERVEGFATEEQWRRAYDEIDGFERTLAADGMIIVKFWLHISDDEQLKRFERASRSAEVLEAHRRGLAQPREAQELQAALEEMLERTDTECAPWQVVPGESKRYARVHVMERGHRRDRGGLRAPRLRAARAAAAGDRLSVARRRAPSAGPRSARPASPGARASAR